MTFLALNGTTIPCLSPGADEDAEEYGADRVRMFDGTMRLTRRGLFRKWTITTNLLTPSQAAAILALINQGNALTATGDLVGSSSGVVVMPVPGKNTPVMTAAGPMRRITCVLEENPTPFIPDTSGVPFAFFQRGHGYLTGAYGDHPLSLTGTSAAGNGDKVTVWKDQTINARHLWGGFNHVFPADAYDNRLDPVLDGNEVKFGVNPAGVDGGKSFFVGLNLGATFDGWFDEMTSGKAEVMIALRAVNAAGSSTENTPWSIGGGFDAFFPFTDGHIYDAALSNYQHDYGLLVPPLDPSSLTVYNVTSWNASVGLGGKTFQARINNSLVYQSDETAHGTVPNVSAGFDLGQSTSSSSHWLGWVRDLLIVDDILTDAQRLSWYRYMTGLDASPPI